jgi:hypothetical protein
MQCNGDGLISDRAAARVQLTTVYKTNTVSVSNTKNTFV